MRRFGRDYLKVGYYTEIFFAEKDVRYIANNDGVDSTKGQSGEHLGEPPYGYIKDTNDKKKWIVDEDAAEVVK